MEQQKLIIIISDVNKALSFEWLATGIAKDRFSLQFILLNKKSSVFENYLTKNKIPVKRFACANKFQLFVAFLKLISYLIKNRPDLIHCHLFEASFVGLTAGWVSRVKKRIYTRHHSILQHTYFPSGVKYDRWCNRMATDIVAISQVVKDTLIEMEGVNEKKIHLIHHGFKLEEFGNISGERLNNIRTKYGILAKGPVIGIISRYLHLKGVEYIIRAFKEVLKYRPDAFLVLANASGDYTSHIRQELKGIPPDNYKEILFEEDLFALYQTFDIFIHVPIDKDSEAFGQTYIEALAAGIPSVFTLSGIANEFIISDTNALVVDYMNSEQIFRAITKLLDNKSLRNTLITNGRMSVERFKLETSLERLELLYLK